MRVVFFSVNDMGLGHLRRSTALLLSCRELAPGLRPLIVTNACFQPLLDAVGAPAVILPQPTTGPRSGPDQLDQRIDPGLFDDLAFRVIEGFLPDLVVFDTYVGAGLLQRLGALGASTCLVFRKCRLPTFVRYVRSRYFGAFDRVVVPHTEAEFKASLPVSALQAFEEQTRVAYVGPMVFPAASDRASGASPVPAPAERLVVLLGGGGGYDSIQSTFFGSARAAVRRSGTALRCLTVVGPFASMPAGVDDGEVIVSPVDVLGHLRRAELVISHGGYNSVNEVLSAGARAIFCPFYRKTEDQRERLTALSGRPATAVVEPDITAGDLAILIQRLLEQPRPSPQRLDGALAAARWLVGEMSRGDARRPCRPGAAPPSPRRACIDLRWDSVGALVEHPMLPVASVNVSLGRGELETLHRRAEDALDGLEAIGVRAEDASLLYLDAGGGEQLPGLVKRLLGRRFRRITGCVSETNDTARARLFHAFEACRALGAGFEFEISTAPLLTEDAGQPPVMAE